jgi:hypothetical protein
VAAEAANSIDYGCRQPQLVSALIYRLLHTPILYYYCIMLHICLWVANSYILYDTGHLFMTDATYVLVAADICRQLHTYPFIFMTALATYLYMAAYRYIQYWFLCTYGRRQLCTCTVHICLWLQSAKYWLLSTHSYAPVHEHMKQHI